jgi:hypothetical protein
MGDSYEMHKDHELRWPIKYRLEIPLIFGNKKLKEQMILPKII